MSVRRSLRARGRLRVRSDEGSDLDSGHGLTIPADRGDERIVVLDEASKLRARDRKNLHPIARQPTDPFIKRLEHRIALVQGGRVLPDDEHIDVRFRPGLTACHGPVNRRTDDDACRHLPDGLHDRGCYNSASGQDLLDRTPQDVATVQRVRVRRPDLLHVDQAQGDQLVKYPLRGAKRSHSAELVDPATGRRLGKHQLRLAGDDEAAQEFADDRLDAVGQVDEAQKLIEQVLEAEPTELALPLGEPGMTSATTTEPTPKKENPVSVSGWSWTYWTYWTDWEYAYCTANGCGEKVGCVNAWLTYMIYWFPEVALNATLNNSCGGALQQRIRVVEMDCTTVHKPKWPRLWDLTVHEWSSCDELESPYYRVYSDMRDTVWNHENPEPGDHYFTEYLVSFKVQGDATDSTLTMRIRTNDYKVPESPGTKTRFII